MPDEPQYGETGSEPMTKIYFGGTRQSSVTCTTERAADICKLLVRQGYRLLDVHHPDGTHWRVRAQDGIIVSAMPITTPSEATA